MQERFEDMERFLDPRTCRQAREELIDRMDELVFELCCRPGDQEASDEFHKLMDFNEKLLGEMRRRTFH